MSLKLGLWINKEKVFKREISEMRLVRHPNIVQLYEVMATKTKIYFVLECLKGGELFDKISKGKLKVDVARKYFQQMISALDYCHSRGVYHRDIKPENLLLDEDGNVKISDFGLSALAASKTEDGLLHTTCGTPAYVAPEVISRKGYDGAKADIWSCGVILFVLLASHLPFQYKNFMEMYRKIGRAEYKGPSWFSPEVRKLLQRILDPNPSTRISLARIMSNYWFRKGLDVIIINKSKVVKETTRTEAQENIRQISNFNAFDIIALSQGFDLCGLFEDSNELRENRFLSALPASTIISKLEKVAKSLNFKVKKKDNGLMKMEKNVGGQMGPLEIDAEIFVLTPVCHLMEIKMINGSASGYRRIWKEEMRPRLEEQHQEQPLL